MRLLRRQLRVLPTTWIAVVTVLLGHCFQNDGANAYAARPVLVTGASGRTGRLVFQSLLQDPRFEPKALVRSESSARKLRRAIPNTPLEQIVVCDVTSESSADDLRSVMKTGSASATNSILPQMVICTSAVPIISKRSLLKAILQVPFNVIRGKPAVNFRSFRFKWQKGQYPELVDYLGTKQQIDVAKQHWGTKQIVLVGSMGGTDPSNFLNSVGKKADGTGHGDILIWKRKAERYLVEQSGLDYVIIHPGGLNGEPGGREKLILDVDDKLYQRAKRSISRADVAQLCVAALVKGQGQKIALDCITEPVQDEENKDDAAFSDVPSAEEALEAFIKEAKVYDYALN